MTSINGPTLSKDLWIKLREWQTIVNLSDEDFAACLKVSIKTLKSYDISAHGLTIEKLDNLRCTYGNAPLLYIADWYINAINSPNPPIVNSVIFTHDVKTCRP